MQIYNYAIKHFFDKKKPPYIGQPSLTVLADPQACLIFFEKRIQKECRCITTVTYHNAQPAAKFFAGFIVIPPVDIQLLGYYPKKT